MQFFGGFDLTGSFSVGVIQQAISKSRLGEKPRKNYQGAKVCLLYVLRPTADL